MPDRSDAALTFHVWRSLALVLVAAAIGAFTWNLYILFPFTVDDTFITLRYSRNVAAGVGVTYNATGPRAEGYSSALWMLLLVVPHLFPLGPMGAVIAAKALSIVATLTTIVVMARWIGNAAADEPAKAWIVALTVIAYLTLPRTAVHAVSGMETALFTLLLTALFTMAATSVTL